MNFKSNQLDLYSTFYNNIVTKQLYKEKNLQTNMQTNLIELVFESVI